MMTDREFRKMRKYCEREFAAVEEEVTTFAKKWNAVTMGKYKWKDEERLSYEMMGHLASAQNHLDLAIMAVPKEVIRVARFDPGSYPEVTALSGRCYELQFSIKWNELIYRNFLKAQEIGLRMKNGEDVTLEDLEQAIANLDQQ